jgi:hypothetical protein
MVVGVTNSADSIQNNRLSFMRFEAMNAPKPEGLIFLKNLSETV